MKNESLQAGSSEESQARSQAGSMGLIRPLVWGSALFSMFFGAGNVIYSLWVGYLASGHNITHAMMGFMLTGITIPFLCLLGMTYCQGSTEDFLSFIKSSRLRLLALSILLIVWSPLGSIPRAIEMTYSSLQVIWPALPWGWSQLCIAVLIGLLASTPPTLVNLLGRWLTPVLLVLITILAYLAHAQWPISQLSALEPFEMFTESGLLGYQTMDGIAAVFFARFFIDLFRSEKHAHEHYWRSLLSTFLIALCIQALVYGVLISTSARISAHLEVSNPAQLFSLMAVNVFGPLGGAMTSWIVVFACIPTAITLVLITENFFRRAFFPRLGAHWAKWIVIAFSFTVSLLQLKGIRALTQPILELAYPGILLLSIWTIARYIRKKPKELQENHVL